MRRSSPSTVTVLALIVLLAAPLAAAAPAPPTAEELARHVAALTAPEMEGRGSATEGGERAARYLESTLAAMGLKPGGDNGTWRQSFVVRKGVRVAPGAALARVGAAPATLTVGQDWLPHGGSQAGEVEGDVVFAGYGADYTGMDIRGKIALVLEEGGTSRLEKLIAARHAGAAAVLVVAPTVPSVERTAASVAIHSATLIPSAVDALLAPSGWTYAKLIQASAAAPGAALATGVRARLAVRVEPTERRADNIIGLLSGTDPALAGAVVVVGAHYDHLGRVNGTVYPGADDNASGTAMVLGLARAFAAAGGAPRTMVFVLFSGEELGLLGSAHYVAHPPLPLDRTVAMVNFDMVGRLRDNRVSVSGIESAAGLRAAVATAGAGSPLKLDLRDSPHGPSDHVRFYTAGVPVVFFNTGRHDDYHKPSDTADRVDTAGMERIGVVALRLLGELAATPRLVYAKVAPSAGRRQPEAQGAQPGSGAFLGVALDGLGESDGLRLGAIVPDTGAARAGLREGDVLVRMGDISINGFDDLRKALARQAPGDTVRVVFLRDGQDQAIPVTLGTRP
jgi:peptidase M28-like protein/PDZ domain-containing protein/PA domain-containing protein